MWQALTNKYEVVSSIKLRKLNMKFNTYKCCDSFLTLKRLDKGFLTQHKHATDFIPDRLSLQIMEKKYNENF